MAETQTATRGGVRVIAITNPPVNALGQAVRTGLAAALAEAEVDPVVTTVILIGRGRGFSGGADITEFGRAPQGVSLPELIRRIEACSKPVVAAIHGMALGGGLELALGAHYRIATRSAKLALPEVKLGLLPGAGGTQRLPRLIGVEAALPMIVSGDPIAADRALTLGLIDAVCDEEELEATALAFATEIVGRPCPRTGERSDRIETAERVTEIVAEYRMTHGRRLQGREAPNACLEAVAVAASTTLSEGLVAERTLFLKLVNGSQSKALRHVFFAERQANKIGDFQAETPVADIRSVGVLGAGTMGSGIAINFLSAGIPVVLAEREQAALERGIMYIRKTYEGSVNKDRMSREAADAAVALLTPSLDLADFADCDLIIEAVFEEMAVKTAVFAQLDAVAKSGAILASNTSYLNIDEMAAATSRPEKVIDLHFFSPANLMKLLEVVRADKTDPPTLATAVALAKRIGKVAVVARIGFGFIGNRMLAVRQKQGQALILEGALPWDVDRVLTDFGLPMGPFQMSDLAGLDLGWNRETSRGETLRDRLCERDRRGQKSGKGWYDYGSDRKGTPSPEVEALIAEFAERAGSPRRDVSRAEILERLLYPMINEAALILEEGIAQRASDIDVVWLNGYGWPAVTGGPLFWADTLGLDTVVAGLMAHADALGSGFHLSSLLARKAAGGGTFNPDARKPDA
jgi:3-hydroxyacyl-CoA dehydrogenase